VRLLVRGADTEACREVLRSVRSDEDLGAMLTPATTGEEPHSNEFGEIAAVQEFLIAVAAGATVEALAAGFRAAVDKLRRGPSEAASPQSTHVEVTTTAPGLVQVTVVVVAAGPREADDA
jgi:hypothetical protein